MKNMENLKLEVKGDGLLITVPNLKAAGKPSSTGKTKLVASTGGYVTLDHPSGAKVMVNVTIPNK
jgi:hypothetical protein